MEELSIRPVDSGRLDPNSVAPVGERGARGGDAVARRAEPADVRVAVEEEAAPKAKAKAAPPGVGARGVEATVEQLEKMTEELNNYFGSSRGVRFKIRPKEEGPGVVVQVVDRSSDKVIRSIPPERLVEFKDSFNDLSGLLLDENA